MNIVDRVKRLLLSPDPEWAVIAGESSTLGSLVSGYVLPLAALSAIGSLLGNLLWLRGYGLGFVLRVAITDLVMATLGVVVLSVVIEAVAPTFGAAKSRTNAAKVAAYAPTPVWIGGFFQIIPYLARLIALIGALYALYFLYLGLMRVMKTPADKAVAYTVVVIVVALVIVFVASYLADAIFGFGPVFI